MNFSVNHLIIYTSFFGLCEAMDDALHQSNLAHYRWESDTTGLDTMDFSGTSAQLLHSRNHDSAFPSVVERQGGYPNSQLLPPAHFQPDSFDALRGFGTNAPSFPFELDRENQAVSSFPVENLPNYSSDEFFPPWTATRPVYSELSAVPSAHFSALRRKRKGFSSESISPPPAATWVEPGLFMELQSSQNGKFPWLTYQTPMKIAEAKYCLQRKLADRTNAFSTHWLIARTRWGFQPDKGDASASEIHGGTSALETTSPESVDEVSKLLKMGPMEHLIIAEDELKTIINHFVGNGKWSRTDILRKKKRLLSTARIYEAPKFQEVFPFYLFDVEMINTIIPRTIGEESIPTYAEEMKAAAVLFIELAQSAEDLKSQNSNGRLTTAHILANKLEDSSKRTFNTILWRFLEAWMQEKRGQSHHPLLPPRLYPPLQCCSPPITEVSAADYLTPYLSTTWISAPSTLIGHRHQVVKSIPYGPPITHISHRLQVPTCYTTTPSLIIEVSAADYLTPYHSSTWISAPSTLIGHRHQVVSRYPTALRSLTYHIVFKFQHATHHLPGPPIFPPSHQYKYHFTSILRTQSLLNQHSTAYSITTLSTLDHCSILAQMVQSAHPNFRAQTVDTRGTSRRNRTQRGWERNALQEQAKQDVIQRDIRTSQRLGHVDADHDPGPAVWEDIDGAHHADYEPHISSNTGQGLDEYIADLPSAAHASYHRARRYAEKRDRLHKEWLQLEQKTVAAYLLCQKNSANWTFVPKGMDGTDILRFPVLVYQVTFDLEISPNTQMLTEQATHSLLHSTSSIPPSPLGISRNFRLGIVKGLSAFLDARKAEASYARGGKYSKRNLRVPFSHSVDLYARILVNRRKILDVVCSLSGLICGQQSALAALDPSKAK
ncbi:hypothetical protein H4Q26_008908 [Puccinia striiformis f. sp. tritici PST-130]|nr:hypothetical protein H4Q26_008908 [Puccinia striiformis f. sp. tritici PST-130]